MGQRQFLVAGLQGRHAVVRHIQRGDVLREFRRVVPLRQVLAGGQADVPADADIGIAVEVEAALAPGAGDDQGFYKISLHAVEIGRLVVLVEQAEGHQEQAAAHGGPVGELVIDVELLHLEFADVAGRGDGVLDFVLGVEAGAVVEGIADAEHRARQIGLGAVRFVDRTGVIDLAVAPQAEVVEQRGAAHRCRHRLRLLLHGLLLHHLLLGLLLLLRQRLVLRLELLQLGFQLLQLLRHLVDFLLQLLLDRGVVRGGIGCRGGGRGQRRCRNQEFYAGLAVGLHEEMALMGAVVIWWRRQRRLTQSG